MQRRPDALSQGERQRVAIARALSAKPRILLADEPTGNLDDEIGFRLMNLFDQLNRMGTTVVIATHNTQILQKFKHSKMILDSGTLRIEDAKSKIMKKLEGVF